MSDSKGVPKSVLFDGYFVRGREKTTQAWDRITPVPFKTNPTCLGQPVVSSQAGKDVDLAPLRIDLEQIDVIHIKIGE